MGENQGCARDVADLAGAGSDVLERAPAASEQGKPSFPEAAQGALEGVAGTGIDIELPSISGLLDRDVNADLAPS
jgi:hypothetical protein